MIVLLLAISAVLFALVTWFCSAQGLFEDHMIGWAFAAGLYIVFWVGGTAFAVIVVALTHWVR